MKVRELVRELEGLDPEAEVRAVQQPSYPLVADLKDVFEDGIEDRGKTVYLHLEDAYDYYSSVEDEDEDDDEDEEA